MTDATGRSFLSYRRSRIGEARLLIAAQHDVGIPTWHDLSELDHGHPEQLIREALQDETTANALCWITPEVETSPVITRVELPSIMKRTDCRDGFFMVPCAAGGLDYADVGRVAGTYLNLHDLGDWNIHKVSADPITATDAATVARLILKRRLVAIHKQLAPGTALQLALNTRKVPAFESGVALAIDWTHRFDGRLATPDRAWAERLLPALETVAKAIETSSPGREIVAKGLIGLPAAVALGTTFLATRRLPISWQQVSPGRAPQGWALSASVEPSGFTYQVSPGSASANDLALLVSVTSSVEAAFARSRAKLPALRGLLTITRPGDYPHDLATAGQAADVVQVVLEGLRKARAEFQPRGTLHLFLAVPAGLAMMIGQVLNTLGPVQTYEHVSTDAVGEYHPAVLLTPSA